MVTLTDSSRDISLQVAYNVRHLGGYATRDNHTTSAQFIRSGALNRLTGAGIDRLREIGVRSVVDFRSAPEQMEEPTPDFSSLGIRVISAPVYPDDGAVSRFVGEWTTTAVAYERILASGVFAFRTLFETIADRDGAVLFHCTAGKDRTGVAAALILDLAGVDRHQIEADYSRSAELLKSEFARWEVELKGRGLGDDQIAEMLSANAGDIATALDYVATRWGSAEGYLAEAGLSETARSAVRARICS